MVVLGEGEVLGPWWGSKQGLGGGFGFNMSAKGNGGLYQFAATIGLLLIFTCLDLGFCFTFGREDLFFFFCRTRPIVGSYFDPGSQS